MLDIILLNASFIEYTFSGKERFHLAQVLKESGPHEGLLIFLDGYLCDFESEIKQKDRHVNDFATHDMEKTSQFSGSHIDKVNLSLLSRLFPNKVLDLNVIILTKQL